jgi:hypothetical protein
MPDEPTLPPHQPNAFKTWLPRIGAWLQTQWRDNRGACVITIVGVLAFIAGAVIF